MGDCRWTGLADPRSLRRLLLIGCAGAALLAPPAGAADAIPTGGHFVAGAGSIDTSGATTTVTQSSRRGIVDWQSFSISKGKTVQFDNGSGATLNKVTGGSLSTIAGQLKATGSVYLINPNGVVVGPSGRVVTGGDFVASTRDVGDSQFMAGGAQTFTGGSNGAVVNDGAVVSTNGNVVLIGHAVTNHGSVDAAHGTAALASGNRVIMTDANGPDRVYVAKSNSGDTTNDGQVRAAAVALAASGGNVYALAGNRDGLIQATGTKKVAGQVWLTAPDGTVDVGGTVAAVNADGSGGTVKAIGASLKLDDTAVVNAAGRTGHGSIETSGAKVSIGKAKVTAGKKGNWTIDPTNLTIDSVAAIAIGAALDLGTNVTEKTTSTVAIGLGVQSPGAGDITVAAPISWNTSAQLTLDSFHNIAIDASINGGATGKVMLNSGGTISEAVAAVITAGTLGGSANGGVSLGGPNQVKVLGPFSNATSSDFNFTNARAFATTGAVSSFGSLTLTTGAGDSLTIGGSLTAGANVNLDIGGTIAQSAGAVITATTLTGSSVGGATLTGANKLANLGPFSDTGAGNATGFSLNNAQSLLTIDTVLSTGPVRLTTTAGSLTIDADVTAAADTVTLKSPGGIDQLGGVIDAASLLVGAAAAVSLPDANKVGTLAAQLTGPGAGLTFNDTATGLTIGTVGGVSGVTTDNGAIVLQTSMSGAIALDRPVDAGTAGVTVAASGNLAIGAGGSVSAGAGATLATLGNFSNAAGAGAITVGAGSRWLVYSSNPNADTDGGLTPSFIQYAATYTIATLTGTAPAAAAGNGFLYSLTPAALTLTGVTKTYDGTTGLIGASYSASGAVAGDTLTFGGAPAGSFAGKNAGSGIDVTVSGLTVTAKRGGITVYGYTVGAVANDPIGAIAKAVLTASLTGTVVKTYDGTTAATLDAGNYALTGIVTGDAVSLNDPAAGSYADKNAASGIAVTVGGLGLVGAEAGNYTLAKTSLTANIGTIDPKTVSAGLTGTVTKNADGTNIATLTPGNYTLSGVVSGDGVSLNDPAHGTYASAQLGSGIAVTVTGLALTGSAARDYVLAGTTATANIGTIRPGLPKTPFIPVQPPQPPASASNSVNAHSLVVPKPELAELVKLSGCTGGDFVAVVPGEDGHVGTVVIEADGNKTILHAAYAGCSGSRPVITTPQEVNAIFGIALTARPAPPLSFELYYRSGSTTLEAQAQAVFGQAVAAIGQRKPVDVVVTGYTDTAGTPHANDILSLARAQAVTKLLLARGLPPGAVATYGRGARELLVPTPDHVAEDKNRRVEITVR